MGRSAVENSVEQMQYTENAARITPTASLGAPSQMRVADSLSYLRMMSSADAVSSVAGIAAPVFFLADMEGPPFVITAQAVLTGPVSPALSARQARRQGAKDCGVRKGRRSLALFYRAAINRCRRGWCRRCSRARKTAGSGHGCRPGSPDTPSRRSPDR